MHQVPIRRWRSGALIQALEPRRLLASQTLITGTALSDLITITKTSSTVASVSIVPRAGGTGTAYSIPLTQPIVVEANAGDDRIEIPIALNVAVTVRGGTGVDELSTTGSAYQPGTTTVALDGSWDLRGSFTNNVSIAYEGFEPQSVVEIDAAATTFTFSAPLDRDAIDIAGDSGIAVITGSSSDVPFVPVRVRALKSLQVISKQNGATGADHISAHVGTIPGMTGMLLVSGNGTNTFDYDGAGTSGSVSILGGTGEDTLTIQNVNLQTSLDFVVPPATAIDTVNMESGNLRMFSSWGYNSVLNFNLHGGTVQDEATLRLKSLNLSAGTAMNVVKNPYTTLRTVSTQALTIADGATLDLSNNSLILDYAGSSPAETLRGLLRSGYANGAWTGAGITSSAAAAASGTMIGFAEAAQVFTTFPATFAGQSVDNTSLLLGFTRAGDTNLDHTVNVTDLGMLATNWQQASRIGSQGDFNYDGTVDVADLGILATNWQQSITVPAQPLGQFFTAPIHRKSVSRDVLADSSDAPLSA